jgi:predicted DsbA family dithiol-disulfide isomerase
MATLRVDVWSDIACPWCYVGKRRLEAALARFGHRDEVELVWRAFELDPSAPRAVKADVPYTERLAKKYRTTVAQAQLMIDRMTGVAKAEGLEFRFDLVHPGNMFDAHRLLHLAHDRGVQDQLKERLFRAYMTDGEALGDPGVLTRIAGEAGLDAGEVTAVLTTDTYAAEVRADEAEARELGITGVPFFVLANRIGVSGAQTADVLLQALETAWETVAAAPPPPIVEGAACGPDGCD